MVERREKNVWWNRRFRCAAVVGLTSASLLAGDLELAFADKAPRPKQPKQVELHEPQSNSSFDTAIRNLLKEAKTAESKGEIDRAIFLAERAAKISEASSNMVKSSKDVSPASTASYARILRQKKAELLTKPSGSDTFNSSDTAIARSTSKPAAAVAKKDASSRSGTATTKEPIASKASEIDVAKITKPRREVRATDELPPLPANRPADQNSIASTRTRKGLEKTAPENLKLPEVRPHAAERPMAKAPVRSSKDASESVVIRSQKVVKAVDPIIDDEKWDLHESFDKTPIASTLRAKDEVIKTHSLPDIRGTVSRDELDDEMSFVKESISKETSATTQAITSAANSIEAQLGLNPQSQRDDAASQNADEELSDLDNAAQKLADTNLPALEHQSSTLNQDSVIRGNAAASNAAAVTQQDATSSLSHAEVAAADKPQPKDLRAGFLDEQIPSTTPPFSALIKLRSKSRDLEKKSTSFASKGESTDATTDEIVAAATKDVPTDIRTKVAADEHLPASPPSSGAIKLRSAFRDSTEKPNHVASNEIRSDVTPDVALSANNQEGQADIPPVGPVAEIPTAAAPSARTIKLRSTFRDSLAKTPSHDVITHQAKNEDQPEATTVVATNDVHEPAKSISVSEDTASPSQQAPASFKLRSIGRGPLPKAFRDAIAQAQHGDDDERDSIAAKPASDESKSITTAAVVDEMPSLSPGSFKLRSSFRDPHLKTMIGGSADQGSGAAEHRHKQTVIPVSHETPLADAPTSEAKDEQSESQGPKSFKIRRAFVDPQLKATLSREGANAAEKTAAAGMTEISDAVASRNDDVRHKPNSGRSSIIQWRSAKTESSTDSEAAASAQTSSLIALAKEAGGTARQELRGSMWDNATAPDEPGGRNGKQSENVAPLPPKSDDAAQASAAADAKSDVKSRQKARPQVTEDDQAAQTRAILASGPIQRLASITGISTTSASAVIVAMGIGMLMAGLWMIRATIPSKQT